MILDANGKVSSKRAALFHVILMLWFVIFNVLSGKVTIDVSDGNINLIEVIINGLFYSMWVLTGVAVSELFFRNKGETKKGDSDANS